MNPHPAFRGTFRSLHPRPLSGVSCILCAEREGLSNPHGDQVKLWLEAVDRGHALGSGSREIRRSTSMGKGKKGTLLHYLGGHSRYALCMQYGASSEGRSSIATCHH